jgi:predicted esterase
MKTTMLNDTVIKSQNFAKPERLVVGLHGSGGSGGDFSEIGETFLSKQLDNTVFLFPDAPQWFNLVETSDCNLKNLDPMSPLLYEYIQDSIKKYGCNNVNVIGFSQGAILAYEMLYWSGISKIIAYSGLFVVREGVKISSNAEVLIIHSDDDNVSPYEEAIFSKEQLDKLQVKNQLKTYHNLGHSISADGWSYGMEFLKG